VSAQTVNLEITVLRNIVNQAIGQQLISMPPMENLRPLKSSAAERMLTSMADIKLTAKVYTDEAQLPIYEAIKNLPRLGVYTNTRTDFRLRGSKRVAG
jgi:hypothetical protein